MTNVRLFAEMIYGMVVHSQVPKRETIDLISEQIAKYFPDAEPVRDSYKLPEPKTCETCATWCLPNERVYVNPDAEDPCPGWTPRSPQSADVETVRDGIDWNIGNLPCTRPYDGDCHARSGTDMRCMNGVRCVSLDRIAGVLR